MLRVKRPPLSAGSNESDGHKTDKCLFFGFVTYRGADGRYVEPTEDHWYKVDANVSVRQTLFT